MMETSTVVAILGSVASSSILAALINFYANRKKVGADATKIITDAAASVVSTLKAQVDELERRDDERDEEMKRHTEVINAQADYIQELRTHIANGKPPPPPPYPANLRL